MSRSLIAPVALMLGAALHVNCLRAPAEVSYSNVILQGATGNLAGKYLWRALFDLHLTNKESHGINFIGAGRDSGEKGLAKVNEFLETRVDCNDRKSLCTEEDLESFRSKVSYEQLKTAEHYRTLCNKLEEAAANGKPESGRLFYLSVPPFAYAGITKMIKEECTPQTPGAWLRVAFEKPFGSDLKSAEEMAAVLAEHLSEQQIYRFDHYLGKVGVQQILDFRIANAASYSNLWNTEHIERIEVFMTETEDCAGRTGFYDEYGIVRDIHQNHLMEVLTLVTMDLRDIETPASILEAKAKLISDIKDVETNFSMIGQYLGYKKHVQADRGDDFDSKTPTFAVSRLTIDNPTWFNTSIVMMAGKMLEKRQAGVVVTFRNKEAIQFHVQGGEPKHGPTVYLTRNLPPAVGADHTWSQSNDGPFLQEHGPSKPDFGESWSVGEGPDLPYNKLVGDMFRGEQGNFVGTKGLLESWRVWDNYLKEISAAEPTVYPPQMKIDFFAHVFAHDKPGIAKSFGEAIFDHHKEEHLKNHDGTEF